MSEIIPVERADEQLAAAVVVRLLTVGTAPEVLDELGRVCRAHRGDRPLFLELTTAEGMKVTVRCNTGGVTPSGAFCEAIDALLGPGHVEVLAAANGASARR